jgi:hypothetical protein
MVNVEKSTTISPTFTQTLPPSELYNIYIYLFSNSSTYTQNHTLCERGNASGKK